MLKVTQLVRIINPGGLAAESVLLIAKPCCVVLTFPKYFPSAGHHTKCFTHFTGEETEAQGGLSNLLKTTRLKLAS